MISKPCSPNKWSLCYTGFTSIDLHHKNERVADSELGTRCQKEPICWIVKEYGELEVESCLRPQESNEYLLDTVHQVQYANVAVSCTIRYHSSYSIERRRDILESMAKTEQSIQTYLQLIKQLENEINLKKDDHLTIKNTCDKRTEINNKLMANI
jgi:hypothetical protein